MKGPLRFLRTKIEIMRKMIFSVGDTGGLDIKMDKNIRRVLLIGVEPCNDLLVTSPDAYHLSTRDWWELSCIMLGLQADMCLCAMTEM